MAAFSKSINCLFCINYLPSFYFHFLSGYLMISLSCIWKCKLNKFYSLIKKLNILKQKDNHFAKFWKKSLHSWQRHSLVPSCCSVFHLTPSSNPPCIYHLPCAMLPDPLSDNANGIIPTPLTNARQWLTFSDWIQLIVPFPSNSLLSYCSRPSQACHLVKSQVEYHFPPPSSTNCLSGPWAQRIVSADAMLLQKLKLHNVYLTFSITTHTIQQIGF